MSFPEAVSALATVACFWVGVYILNLFCLFACESLENSDNEASLASSSPSDMV
jgi:hypothetical protein